MTEDMPKTPPTAKEYEQLEQDIHTIDKAMVEQRKKRKEMTNLLNLAKEEKLSIEKATDLQSAIKM